MSDAQRVWIGTLLARWQNPFRTHGRKRQSGAWLVYLSKRQTRPRLGVETIDLAPPGTLKPSSATEVRILEPDLGSESLVQGFPVRFAIRFSAV
jgi:hypothetical protein